MGFTRERTFLGLTPTIILSLLLLACSGDGTGPGKELDPSFTFNPIPSTTAELPPTFS